MRKTKAERGRGREEQRGLTVYIKLPAEGALDGCPEKDGTAFAVIVGEGEPAAVGRERVLKLANGFGEQAASALLNALAANLGSAAAATGGADYVGAVDASGREGRNERENDGKLHLD